MSTVISASSATADVEITGAVAAVSLVFSDASIVILVPSAVVPLILMSMVEAELPAVSSEARTSVRVNACGARKYPTLVAASRAVERSEHDN
jgi:hypothetical protein